MPPAARGGRGATDRSFAMNKPAPSAPPLGRLPSIGEADRHLEAAGLPSGRAVRGRVEAVLAEFRRRLKAGPQAVEELPSREDVLRAVEAAIRRPDPGRLRRVINATGVVVHTNLGRAVLSPDVTARGLPLAHAYTNLEFDLATGKRGRRGGRVPELLAQLAGAEQETRRYVGSPTHREASVERIRSVEIPTPREVSRRDRPVITAGVCIRETGRSRG